MTGHRLLRDGIRPGGVVLRALPDPAELRSIAADLAEIAALTLGKSLIRDRFTGTAPLSLEHARELGCLGYVARASGLTTDARIEHPTVALPVRPVLATAGDVLARFTIRRDEFAASVDLAGHLIDSHTGPLDLTGPSPRASGRATSGCRHRRGLARNDRAPRRTRCRRSDCPGQGCRPVLVQLAGAAVALADTIVPDFPLVNKSFNLSYAGNDL